MPHENGNGLMTDEKIGFEDTCDFILPQKKKEGKKAIFPFEVNQNINYTTLNVCKSVGDHSMIATHAI